MDKKDIMSAVDELKSLTAKLNKASEAYYGSGNEIMTNYEYDALYYQLCGLESETGIVLAGSPTQKVGFLSVSKLEKDRHEEPALSLDKTKDREFVKGWLKGRDGVMSWKLDGLTIVATYDGGTLTKAVTRGNGETGEIVTHNAPFFHGLPRKIPFNGHLVVRGEAFIPYSTFERINEGIPEGEPKYKNPRNLASGTVRQLDPGVVKARGVQFRAFELVSIGELAGEVVIAEGMDMNLFTERLRLLALMGFGVVGHVLVTEENEESVITDFEKSVGKNDFPSDGLVLMYNDIAYGRSLGTTGKYPRCGIAFKWADEMAETTLRKVEWNASRTGLINPVAVFDTVELEGTEVSRATAHNVSIFKKLKLSPGSTIRVYKANMIVPTIHENVKPSGWDDSNPGVPDVCPVCGAPTELRISPDGVETLCCPNSDCPAKHVKAFAHFVRRDSMNVENLSESTIQKLMNAGLVKKYKDLYYLKGHIGEISALEGMGERSAKQLVEAIEKSRNTTLDRFLSGFGIPLVGRSASKEIHKAFGGDFGKFMESAGRAWMDGAPLEITGFGEKMTDSLLSWMSLHWEEVSDLAQEMTFKADKSLAAGSPLSGKTFVITGSLTHYQNRDALKNEIESLGGKVSGSVSAKTSFLINNDINSSSGKNKKARELGIPVISEEGFIGLLQKANESQI